MLGISLQFLSRMAEAEAALRKSIEIDAGYAHGYNNLGNLYQTQGRLEEAARYFRRALEVDPALYEAHSNVLFCLSHDERVAPADLFAEHVRFGERFEGPLKAHWKAHADDRDPERPLRVGFVSADLRSHAVAYFIEPVFQRLAGRPGLQLYAYSNSEVEDAFTERLRGHVAQWRKVTGDSDARLAERIREDKIDILVDLSGHTRKYRLLAFARKPAPVQVSWIGYPGTTGLTAMDYYLADRHFLPPGKLDEQFTEKLVQMPASVPFQPSVEAPEVSPLPALENGHLTFGSFNRLSKISETAIACWSGLLRAFAGSRMLIAGMPNEDGYRDLRIEFQNHGIDPARLTFHPRSAMKDYLSLHAQVDFCLDTFGYTGGTTTLHAIWMGVPTLTHAGATPAGRQGASIMLHMGLAGYVAKDPKDFIRRGKRIGSDLAALQKLRSELRGRMQASALGRPDKVADGLEQALRRMWRRWCEGEPPKSFTVR
jgi:protein O-GlcNAc transferase